MGGVGGFEPPLTAYEAGALPLGDTPVVREAGFEPAVRVAQRVYGPPSEPIGHLHAWCDRRDSNPHGLAATPSRGARYTNSRTIAWSATSDSNAHVGFDGRVWAGWVYQIPPVADMFRLDMSFFGGPLENRTLRSLIASEARRPWNMAAHWNPREDLNRRLAGFVIRRLSAWLRGRARTGPYRRSVRMLADRWRAYQLVETVRIELTTLPPEGSALPLRHISWLRCSDSNEDQAGNNRLHYHCATPN